MPSSTEASSVVTPSAVRSRQQSLSPLEASVLASLSSKIIPPAVRSRAVLVVRKNKRYLVLTQYIKKSNGTSAVEQFIKDNSQEWNLSRTYLSGRFLSACLNEWQGDDNWMVLAKSITDSVRVLNLENFKLNCLEAFLKSIPSSNKIQTLNLRGNHGFIKDFSFLKDWKELRDLTLCTVDNNVARFLPEQLLCLRLNEVQVNDTTFKTFLQDLKCAPSLQVLEIQNHSLSGAFLETLVARFSALETLDLSYAETKICWPAYVRYLLQLPRLQTLSLYDTNVDDRVLQVLALHPQLKQLDVGGNEQVTDKGAGALFNNPHLLRLNLESTSVSKKSVSLYQEFVKNRTIEHLDLTNTK